MNDNLLSPYEFVEEAMPVLIREVEAHLEQACRPHFLRTLGRKALEGFAMYGAAMSGVSLP